MKDTIVAARYAKSLLDLSIELKSLKVVLANMKMIYAVCSENSELTAVLKSPIIKSDKKLSILNEIFGKQICPLTQKFLNLLSVKTRESYIMDIAEQFLNQYKLNKGITSALVISASALDDSSRKRILEMVKTSSKSEVELEEKNLSNR